MPDNTPIMDIVAGALWGDCRQGDLVAGDPAERTRFFGLARAAMQAMRAPSRTMLDSAREWSRKRYGKPIGDLAATECWQAMLEAAISGSQATATASEHAREAGMLAWRPTTYLRFREQGPRGMILEQLWLGAAAGHADRREWRAVPVVPESEEATEHAREVADAPIQA